MIKTIFALINYHTTINYQIVVYNFKCDSCDADYIGYTTCRLYQRIEEHKASVVGKHMKEVNGVALTALAQMFSILKKCRGKLDCLIQEMLFIRERKPKLNTKRFLVWLSRLCMKLIFQKVLSSVQFHSRIKRRSLETEV